MVNCLMEHGQSRATCEVEELLVAAIIYQLLLEQHSGHTI